MKLFTGLLKSLFQGSPVFMRKLNGFLTLAWIVMIPISIVTGWIHSVTYVAALSLWALVASHWSAWASARVEVKQEELEEKQDEQDIAQDVTNRLVEQTQIEPTN